MFNQIWQILKNFLQEFFNRRSEGTVSLSRTRDKKPPKPYKPLSDTDYEYLFSQLLEGIAYGWQPGRIQRFFDTLEERGQKEGWLDWLERYGTRVLSAPNRDRELGRRMVKLGEQTHALPANSPARKIGAIASRIGSELLSQSPTTANEIWQYDGPDLQGATLPPPPATEDLNSSSPEVPQDSAESPPSLTVESLEMPLEELLARFEADPDLAHQVAQQLGIAIADPQAAIREVARQLQQTHRQASMTAENAEDPEAWFNRGVQQYELEDFAEAIACWDKAVELQPDYYQAWSNRGLALKNLGRWDEVLSSYDRALELEPTYDKAWYNRGIALSELGRYGEAIASFDRLLDLNPDDYKTWYSRGNTLQRGGQHSEAIASYDRALELKADLPEVWYGRGEALTQDRQYSEAIASYDRALELKADLPEVWHGRGEALANIGSCEEAIASYDRALQLKPDAWEVWLGRSQIAKLSDRADLLLSSLSAIAQSNPRLNQRGEAGQLASLEAGLNDLYPNTHPEGWGRLHWHIGQIHYQQGCEAARPFELWRQAIQRYNEALTTLTEEAFPLAHLDVLQDLIQAQWGLEKTAQANKLLERGQLLRQKLLDDPAASDSEKRQIALKFARLDRLSVDLAVQSGELIQALEQAEQDKHQNFTAQFSEPRAQPERVRWQAVRQLLDPTTAIVCWHLSPIALTAFILRQDAPEPIVLGQPPNVSVSVVLTPSLRAQIKAARRDREELSRILLELLGLERDDYSDSTDRNPPDECPEALQNLQRFQKWASHWERLRAQPQSWRKKLPELLVQLGEILDLPAILREIERESSQSPQTKIQNLILIPHQALNHFPLQALFSQHSTAGEGAGTPPTELTVSAFPSLQLCIESLSALAVEEERERVRGLPERTLPSHDDRLSLLSIEASSPEDNGQSLSSQPNPDWEWMALNCYYPQSQRLLDPDPDQAIAALRETRHLWHYRGSTQAQTAALVLGGSDRLPRAEVENLSLAGCQLVSLLASPVLSHHPELAAEPMRWGYTLLAQGATHVLISRWPVESIASTLFAVEFYRQLAAGNPPPAALKRAQQWLKTATSRQLVQWYLDRDRELMREDGPPAEIWIEQAGAIQDNPGKMESTQPPYAHPYYWAGYAIAGRLPS